jgi:hypothetical protein
VAAIVVGSVLSLARERRAASASGSCTRVNENAAEA